MAAALVAQSDILGTYRALFPWPASSNTRRNGTRELHSALRLRRYAKPSLSYSIITAHFSSRLINRQIALQSRHMFPISRSMVPRTAFVDVVIIREFWSRLMPNCSLADVVRQNCDRLDMLGCSFERVILPSDNDDYRIQICCGADR